MAPRSYLWDWCKIWAQFPNAAGERPAKAGQTTMGRVRTEPVLVHGGPKNPTDSCEAPSRSTCNHRLSDNIKQ
ncbi:unnamed protein product, partial [Iphiclides podalirius]